MNDEKSNHLLEEINQKLQILSLPIIMEHLSDIFGNVSEVHIYQLTDGNNSARDIQDITGENKDKISRRWRSWENDLGIVEKSGQKYKKKYSVYDLIIRYSKTKD